MTGGERAYRVAMAGASTLLGREILAVLKTRNFPARYVVGIQDRGREPDAPILDIGDDPLPVIQESEGAEYDLMFRVADQASPTALQEGPGMPGCDAHRGGPRRRFVIDTRAGAAPSNSILSMPLFDDADQGAAAAEKGADWFVCPHAATIAVAGLVLRLQSRLEIRHSSALVFSSASELGPDAIDELQKQTIALLNFGEVPRRVFGAQAAFNVSPRLAGRAKARLAATEDRVRSELERILAGRAPTPALRLVQAPSFYSMAFSIYVQSPQKAAASQVEQALYGENLQWVRASRPSPSPVDVQGSASLLLDPVVAEAGSSGGFWLWGRVDDLRLAAENAVAVAERLAPLISEP